MGGLAAALIPGTNTLRFQYVPDGFTAASWKKYQQDEKKKKQTKNLGGLGPRGFQSRSMQSFQEALERGEADHLMPVFNAKEKIRAGKIRPEDVPVSCCPRGDGGLSMSDGVVLLASLLSFFSLVLLFDVLVFFTTTTVHATRRKVGQYRYQGRPQQKCWTHLGNRHEFFSRYSHTFTDQRFVTPDHTASLPWNHLTVHASPHFQPRSEVSLGGFVLEA